MPESNNENMFLERKRSKQNKSSKLKTKVKEPLVISKQQTLFYKSSKDCLKVIHKRRKEQEMEWKQK